MLGSTGIPKGVPMSCWGWQQDAGGARVLQPGCGVWPRVEGRRCCGEGERGCGASWALHAGEEEPGLSGRDFSAL